jgi:Glycosyl transferase family 2
VFAAILSCAYLWEICDALGTEQWRRRITPDVTFEVDDRDLPMISLHVPAHNEPPGMVIDTLRSLQRSNYPRYEVILIDDNTDDESLWRPVEDWCGRHGVKFTLRRGTGASWAETTLALLGFAGIAAALSRATQLSGFLLAGLLLFPTLGMAAAPVNSWAAQRAALPQWLRERRTSEFRRDRSAFTAGVSTGGLVAVLGVVVAAAVLLLTPSHHPVTTPNLVGPPQGSTATPAASPSASPAQASPSSAPSTAPATTPAPTRRRPRCPRRPRYRPPPRPGRPRARLHRSLPVAYRW